MISQKSEYGLRALVDISINCDGNPVNRSEIAMRQQIPLPYLTQVLSALVNGKLLVSSRGPSGGYFMGRPAEEISLLEVITLLQGPVSPTYCAGTAEDGDCERFDGCGLAGVWARLKSANEEVLGQTTIKDIIGNGSFSVIEGDEALPDEKLDCIGVPCPLPIVRISQAMMELEPGQVLEVWADDEGAKADIPAWCTGTGNDFLGREEFGNQMKFLVRKVN
jgi:Rrf2 family protein